ncbi:MAG: hypothetical protein WKG07_20440 [Hymenobacter sp.]
MHIDYNQDGDFADSVRTGGEKRQQQRRFRHAQRRLHGAQHGPRSGKTRPGVNKRATTPTPPALRQLRLRRNWRIYTLTISGGAAIAAEPTALAGLGHRGLSAAMSYRASTPNPASSLLRVELSSGTEVSRVEVFDVRGAAAPAARRPGRRPARRFGLAAASTCCGPPMASTPSPCSASPG